MPAANTAPLGPESPASLASLDLWPSHPISRNSVGRGQNQQRHRRQAPPFHPHRGCPPRPHHGGAEPPPYRRAGAVCCPGRVDRLSPRINFLARSSPRFRPEITLPGEYHAHPLPPHTGITTRRFNPCFDPASEAPSQTPGSLFHTTPHLGLAQNACFRSPKITSVGSPLALHWVVPVSLYATASQGREILPAISDSR